MPKTSRAQLCLGTLGIVAVLCLSWIALRAQDQGIDVFARSGYWITFAMLATWMAVIRTAIPKLRWHEVRLTLAIAAIGTAVCFASSPIGFKVLSDETNLLSVSQSMYQHKTAHHPTMGKFYYENFHATFVSPPSRPLVFPFLLSVVHSITGYHARNAFILNAVVLFTLLFLVGEFTRRALGIWDAVTAVLLLLSQPIVQLTATSGGFDLLSVLVMLGVLLTSYHHIQVRTADSLAVVWMTLLIYAQVRYESIIALPLVMGFLIIRGYVAIEMLQARFAYFACGALFLFPWFMQRHLNRNSFENPPGVLPFSASHFFDHLKELIATNLDFRFYFPYNNLLNIAAVILLVALYVSQSPQRFTRRSCEQRDFLSLAVLVVGGGLIVFLSHHMGKAGHPTQARFFIPVCVALAGVPLLARRYRTQWFSSTSLLAGSVALFVLYQPIVGESRFMHELLLTRQTRLAMDYLATIGHRRILTVSDRSGQYAALGIGAVDFQVARREADQFVTEFQRRLFDELVVFQEVEYATNEPIEDQQLPNSFQLQIVAEHQLSSDRKLRISRSDLASFPRRIEHPPELSSDEK